MATPPSGSMSDIRDHHPVLSPEHMQSADSDGEQHGGHSTGHTRHDNQASRIQSREKLQRQDSDPNAQSIAITQADGSYTYGTVNQHPQFKGEVSTATTATPSQVAPGSSINSTFRVGVSEDRNKKCRRTMEDAHAFVYDFAGVKGQGYFAVFDGHAGKHAAEWCGENFHKYLLKELNNADPDQAIPDLLNQTFHIADGELSKLAAQGGTHSGCTAVTAFLRLEDADGNPVQLDESGQSIASSEEVGSHAATGGVASSTESGKADDADISEEEKKRKFGDGAHRERIKSFFGSSKSNAEGADKATEGAARSTTETQHQSDKAPAVPKNAAKRTLYTANVGDARAVLCRGGKAVRLTYDHKGSDAQEAKRITDAGGFVMNNRVNGVLAVTRSLGDSSMKEFVVGSPYTTETSLGDEDKFLIIACDGLWDVCEDQKAVDLIRDIEDAQEASRVLLDHALGNFSTDNLSVLVVHLQP